MMTNSNDDELPVGGIRAGNTDTHGRAAILLVESLIHGLIARSVISVEEAVDIVDIAADVEEVIGEEARASCRSASTSYPSLKSISASLSHDLRLA